MRLPVWLTVWLPVRLPIWRTARVPEGRITGWKRAERDGG